MWNIWLISGILTSLLISSHTLHCPVKLSTSLTYQNKDLMCLSRFMKLTKYNVLFILSLLASQVYDASWTHKWFECVNEYHIKFRGLCSDFCTACNLATSVAPEPTHSVPIISSMSFSSKSCSYF